MTLLDTALVVTIASLPTTIAILWAIAAEASASFWRLRAQQACRRLAALREADRRPIPFQLNPDRPRCRPQETSEPG